MRRVRMNDLPRYSVWPKRLLGLEPWAQQRRDADKIQQEYNAEKYARLLEIAEERNLGPSTLRAAELVEVIGRSEECCVSFGNKLYMENILVAQWAVDELLRRKMAPYIEHCNTIVELGCGWGYNLWQVGAHWPGKRYIGGDVCHNALQIAGKVYPGHVYHHDMQNMALPGDPIPPVLVFTCQSIEQLPSAGRFIDNLLKQRHLDLTVCHFEPDVASYDENSLLGLLRMRYNAVNDYNHDLRAQLDANPDIVLLELTPNAIGVNPLNPVSFLAWRPR